MNADVFESTATGLDDDGDDDLLGQRITLLSQRLSQSHDEMENKQKTADDLKAKVDTPTLGSPKLPFAVDLEQVEHTPATTSKTQKNWMEALAEKARGKRSSKKGQYKVLHVDYAVDRPMGHDVDLVRAFVRKLVV